MKQIALALLCVIFSTTAQALNITKVVGWFESGYVTWDVNTGITYNVYIRQEGGSYTKLDNELVRKYGSYLRADAVGLKAGKYQFKVEASNGETKESEIFTVAAHDRNGFAHLDWSDGIGAYKNDGTLKDNARVIYLTADNAKTVKCYVQGDKDVEYTGIQAILAAYEKGKETRPLDVRIIGTVKKADLDAIGSSKEGLQVKGKSGTNPMNITIEGIGNDATVHGFGFLVRAACSVEFRNFAIMICMDDCISLDTDNKHCWVHNMDFFYGGTGSDSDQAKGDGTVDIKGKSSHITVSYNHFFDSGKCSLGGMKSETTDCWMTYHHNWFDHSDSRHPRIRTAFYHVYNNYFDGNAKYGVGVTSGGSSFVESNYFRNCKYPMLSSKQGTDAEGDGTFSGENGGVNKAFNNKIINAKKVQYYSDDAASTGAWDAVLATTRNQSISATAYVGGTEYNSDADNAARTAVPTSAIDDVNNVALICRGEMTGREGLGAGRIDGGDVKWTFLYSTQDANYDVITDLKQTLLNYKSTLVGFADGTNISNGGATECINSGDGKGKTQAIDEKTPAPTWGADVPDSDSSQKTYIGGADGDFYWFNADNDTQTKKYNADGIITWNDGCGYGTDKYATSTDGTFKDPYTGAITLAKTSGYATFYCPEGISSISLCITRAGDAAGKILTSNDGITFNEASSYSYKKGTYTSTHSLSDAAKYVRITNTSNGTLYVHGVKVFAPGEEEVEPGEEETDPKEEEIDKRAESTLSVTSDSKVTLEEGKTSQIAITGAAGEVTYTSSKTNVVTVSESGLITAVGAGTATITINDAGSSSVKAGSATVSVVVTAKLNNELICSFSASDKKPSSSMVSISGNYSNSKGTVTYRNTDYKDCVKMETATEIKITPTDNCTITLIFDSTSGGKKINLDGESTALDSNGKYSFTASAGTTYTLKKGDSINLFLVVFTPIDKLVGDANNDKKVDIEDVTAIIAYLIDKSVVINTKNADIDGDEDVDKDDVEALIEKLLNK